MRRLAHVTELLTIVCLTEFVVHLGGAETSWRNVKAKLKADLRERRANISNVNPGDDVTNRTIDLMIYFWPFAVTQIDEVKQTVSTVSSYVISWWDSSLAWNMQDYDNISFITENINNIWSPKITIPNSADNANWVLPSVIDFCYIWHNGTVTIFTTVFVDTYCDLDLTSYPFDQQNDTNYTKEYHILHLQYRHTVGSDGPHDTYRVLDSAHVWRKNFLFGVHLFVHDSVPELSGWYDAQKYEQNAETSHLLSDHHGPNIFRHHRHCVCDENDEGGDGGRPPGPP
uniref:Neurotransmitter-gated ion-channel ligand-binding domain-containing protein n=1 Tax=Biomphalaria glabrata TaxID=6526 RepID=A0A2C9LPT5_BIOGL